MMRNLLKFLLIVSALLWSPFVVYGQDLNLKDRFDVAIAEAKASMLTDPEAALARGHAAEKLAAKLENTADNHAALATAEWLQGEALYRLNRLDEATPLIAKARALAQKNGSNNKLRADILLSSGSIHGAKAEVAAALLDFQYAHDLFEKMDDNRGQSISLICLASLYSDANDNESALRYLKTALNTYDIDPNIAVSIYNNRGAMLQDIGRYSAAEQEYSKALLIEKKLKSPLLRARIVGNLARNRLKAGRIALADRMIREGLELTARGEAAGWRPQILGIAAQSALQRRDAAQAGRLVAQAFAGVDLTQTSLSSREAHKTAYETYRRLNQPALALAHLMALKRLDDEATKLATNASTALMGARFDFANQELRITKLKADDLQRSIAFERDKARTERLVFLGAGAATLILILILAAGVVTLRRSRNAVRAANTDLAATNAALGKALAARTEFLATTSHEIRTPLNGILGMAQVMLADTKLDATMRDRVQLVHDAGTTMRGLVDDILDVAKIETGNLTIETAPFDIATMMADTCRLWEAQARAKGLAFAVTIAFTDHMVNGDAVRVRQIVSNLLSNALKFTTIGTVGVRAWQRAGDSACCITISDSGIGIAVDKRNDIFESFRQADTSTTRQFGGTGLGLSICRSLARAMGGDVLVDSVAGQGSTFTLTLPLEIAENRYLVEAAARGEPALLIVDRNPISRSMFRTLLSPHVGCIVFADSVDDAVHMIDNDPIDAVLVDDATLREFGDTDLGLRLIVSTAREKSARTILLWPLAVASDPAAPYESGVNAIVGKPVASATLLAALFATDRLHAHHVSLVTHAA